MIASILYAWRYARYYIQAQTINSVHSPFVYDFLEEIVLNKTPFYAFKSLSLYREHLSLNNDKISIQDLGAGSKKNNKSKRKVSRILNNSVKRKKYAEIIFRIIEKNKPVISIELGTSLGLTTMYMSKANTNGKVITLEGSPELAEFAGNKFKKFKCENVNQLIGNFDTELPKVISKIDRVDFAFIDGNHREKATIQYFELLLTKKNENTIFIFDDIHWSKEMEIAWEKIKSHDLVSLSIDLFEMGIVFFQKRNQKEHFTVRF